MLIEKDRFSSTIWAMIGTDERQEWLNVRHDAVRTVREVSERMGERIYRRLKNQQAIAPFELLPMIISILFGPNKKLVSSEKDLHDARVSWLLLYISASLLDDVQDRTAVRDQRQWHRAA